MLKNLSKFDILIFCETWHETFPILTNKMFELNFSCFESKATRTSNMGRASGGLLILVNKDLYSISDNDVILQNNFIILILRKFKLFIIGIYINQCTDLLVTLNLLFDMLHRQSSIYQNFDICILGDFNARMGELNQINHCLTLSSNYISESRSSLDQFIDRRGINLSNFMEDNGLILLNGRVFDDYVGLFTHISDLGNSVIDLAWVNLDLIRKIDSFSIKNIVSMSDHFPIEVNFDFKPQSRVSYSRSIKSLRWFPNLKNTYVNFVNEFRFLDSLNVNVNNLASNFSDMIQKFALINNSFVYNNKQDKAPWYDKDLKKSKRQVKDELQKCIKTDFKEWELTNAFNLLKKKHYTLCAEKKKLFTIRKCYWSQNLKVAKIFGEILTFLGRIDLVSATLLI